MNFEQQLTLILTRGIPAESARLVAIGEIPAAIDGDQQRQVLLDELEARGLLRRGVAVAWPDRQRTAALAAQLEREEIKLACRGADPYPARISEWLNAEAPAWVWVAGAVERLAAPACSVVGSRLSPPRFLEAAKRLAAGLAEAGICIASGMAPGADQAAHDGARGGRAGTIGIPARGILTACLNQRVCRSLNMTAVALGRPWEPFSAGLAIRRNGVITAMGDGLVLVAGGLRGGSSHAVRWATSWQRPMWCFEAGKSSTPPANRHLLADGLAEPLPLSDTTDQWVARIKAGLAQRRTRESDPQQLDLLNI